MRKARNRRETRLFEQLEDRRMLATFTVDTTVDENDGNFSAGDFSLREAVIRANQSPGADSIQLGPGTFRLTIAGTGENNAATGDLDILGDLTIGGAGAGVTIIDANGIDRVLHVLGGANGPNLNLQSLTITGGVTNEQGAGIFSTGSLNVYDSEITGNEATVDHGGGIAIHGPGPVSIVRSEITYNTSATQGGGIVNVFGVLNISDNSVISNNTAPRGGGIWTNTDNETSVDLNGSEVRNNNAEQGGGIFAFDGASVMVTNSSISDNTASGDSDAGGGIFNSSGSTVMLTNSTLAGNMSDAGGGIFNEGTVSMAGGGLSGNMAPSGVGRGGAAQNGGNLTLTGVTVTGNSAASVGGAIENGGTLIVESSTFSDNTAGQDGGAIRNANGGSLEVRDSTFSMNDATTNSGGAIWSSDQATVDNSTFNGNTAAVSGGALAAVGGTFNLTNSTVSDNTAGSGAGIINSNSAPSVFQIAHSTITGNSTVNFGRGGGIDAGGTVRIHHTIVAGNNSPTPDIAGTVTSQGFNLIGNTSGASGLVASDLTNVNPLLGPLQNNGGLTQTHELQVGSPAIDAGDPSFSPPPNTDQRGGTFDRVGGGRIDIGAFELQDGGGGADGDFIVNSIGDSDDVNLSDGICDDGTGACTLRAAIQQANASPNIDGTQVIGFDIPGTGPHTIRPLSALPAIIEAVLIDGASEPDYAGSPVIEIDGDSAESGANGLFLDGAASAGSTIRGLAIKNFDSAAIRFERTSGGHTISGNVLGLDVDGSTAAGNLFGLHISSANNTIENNVISGNNRGVLLNGGGATGNTVRANLIGTNADGNASRGNGKDGVKIRGGSDNIIGGPTEADGNVISANLTGVAVFGASANNNTIQYNLIGTKSTGDGSRGNYVGINLIGTPDNTIKDNVIAGSKRQAVRLIKPDTTGTLIEHNLIGLDLSGAQAIATKYDGIQIANAPGNTVRGNVIANSGFNGIRLLNTNATGNIVQGNLIGTALDGTTPMGNSLAGILIKNAPNNQIGGTEAGEGNTISANGEHGILIERAGATGNVIEGNHLGTDISGTAALGNAAHGIQVDDGAGNVIGGTAAGAGNVIGGNLGAGIAVTGGRATIQGNAIGTDSSGTLDLGNGSDGVNVAAPGIIAVGGTTLAAANVIAHNRGNGVKIKSGMGNAIRQNSIFENLALGIDLKPNGATQNDNGDTDNGANNLQNTPELQTVKLRSGNLDLTYRIDSTTTESNYPLTVEFFLADADGEEGQTFVGSDTYAAADATNLKTATIPAGLAALGDRIVATATDAEGNTSEFSIGDSDAALIKDGNTPIIDDQTFLFDVNSPDGAAVGTVAASDPNGDDLSFEIIAGDPEGIFLIDSDTGEITVPDTEVLDITTTSTYEITVEVTDFGNPPRSASATVTIELVLSRLAGPPNDVANDHIPDIPFPIANPKDYIVVGEEFAISFRELLLVFKDSTTIQEANDLLVAINAGIKGALPEGNLLLLQVSEDDLGDFMDLTTQLNANPRVAFALMEMGGTPDSLPPHNITLALWDWRPVPNQPEGPAFDGNWGLELIRAPQMWSLDTFAQREQGRVANVISAGVVDSGFTDTLPTPGSSTHPDLTTLRMPAGVAQSDHGTMVAGIIGAAHNSLGVEGISPWVDQIDGRASVFRIPFPGIPANDLSTWGRQLGEILSLLRGDATIKVVNNSYGLSNFYSNSAVPINPETTTFGAPLFGRAVDLDGDNNSDTWAQVVERFGDVYQYTVDAFASTVRNDFFVVASAGNAGSTFNAVDNSPIANAAIRHGGHFLTVESIDWNNTASAFSDVGGSISAPGECVRSTEVNNGQNYDDLINNVTGLAPADGVADCLSISTPPNWANWWDGTGLAAAPTQQLYTTSSGTSFAAPYVTGLIAALKKLDLSLTVPQLRQLITDPQFTVETSGATKPRIDAFAAAIGIDVVRNDAAKTIQKALVDVDDGSLDGNSRTDSEDVDNDQDFGEPYETIIPQGINLPDRRRGDGSVNMKDFRAFRDATLQAALEFNLLNTADVMLDGDQPAPMPGDPPIPHFKKDLNADGVVDGQIVNPFAGTLTSVNNEPPENIHARYDFNGSGRLDPGGWLLATGPEGVVDAAPFKIDPQTVCNSVERANGCLRDIDVLADSALWTLDEENVSIADLLADRNNDNFVDYLRSADFHFVVDKDPAGTSGGDLVVEIESLDGGILRWTKSITIPAPTADKARRVVTVPLFGARDVDVTVTRAGASGTRSYANVVFGQDQVVQIKSLTVDIDNRTLNEGDSGSTVFDFPISLSEAINAPVQVPFSTSDGTATVANNDYDPSSDTMPFAANQTAPTTPLEVLVNGDETPEPDETFSVTLSAAVAVPTTPPPTSGPDMIFVVIPKSAAMGTILNDDSAPPGSETWIGTLTGTAFAPCSFAGDPYFNENHNFEFTIESSLFDALGLGPPHVEADGTFNAIETVGRQSTNSFCTLFAYMAGGLPIHVNPNGEDAFGNDLIQISSTSTDAMGFSVPLMKAEVQDQFGGDLSSNYDELTLTVTQKAVDQMSGTWEAGFSYSVVENGMFTLTRTSPSSVSADMSLAATGSIDALSAAALVPELEAAVIRPATASLDTMPIARPASVNVVIKDLPGRYFGLAGSDLIDIDRDATRLGRFVDPTPPLAEEHDQMLSTAIRRLRKDRDAARRIELTTNVYHESRHKFELPDLYDLEDANDLMYREIERGVHELPMHEHVDIMFASGDF